MVGLKTRDGVIPIHSENLMEIFLFHAVFIVYYFASWRYQIISPISAAMTFRCISKTSLFLYFS